MKIFIWYVLFLAASANIASANSIIATAKMGSIFADPTISVNAIRVVYNDRYNQVNIGYEPTYILYDISGPFQFGTPYILDSGAAFDAVVPLMTDGLNDSISFLAQHNPPIYAGGGWNESHLFYNVSLPVYDVPPAAGVDLLGYAISSMELTLYERIDDENIDAILTIKGASLVPEPSSALLFTTGTIILVGVARLKKQAIDRNASSNT